LNTPVSLVTVCVEESLFVQVTVVPTATVRVDGEKAKLDMIMLEPFAVVPVDVVCVVLLPELHALIPHTKSRAIASKVMY
jgi:hypothetical protein